MKKLIALLLAAVLLSFTAVSVAEGIIGGPGVMFVYTENGKGLNVRSAPVKDDNIIGSLPYGSKVDVTEFNGEWATIRWGDSYAYVQSRFLQWYKPSPYYPVTPTAAPTRVPVTPTAAPYVPTDTLATLNAEFRTARFVTPFTVSVRPARASGWVNMRWAPSKDTEVIAQYRSGARLTVLAETQSWYQVEDPDSYVTGFIMKAYVTRVY